MNKILDYSGFTKLIYLNENDTSNKQITRKEVSQKLHDIMYNLVQKIAYGENQREKNNPKYAWVKYLVPKIWNEMELWTNPNNGSFVTQENTRFHVMIERINNCNIKVEIPKEEIEKITFKSTDDLKKFIATSAFSQEIRKELLKVVEPLEYEMIGTYKMPLISSDDVISFFDLPGIEFFGIKQGNRDAIANQFKSITERRLKKIFYEIFKNKFFVPSEEIKKPEVSDTAQKVVKSVKRNVSAERNQTPVRTRLTTDDLSKWGL